MTLESIVKKIGVALGSLALTGALVGCATPNTRRAENCSVPTYATPVNAAVGYFGALATHEAGHAATAHALGATSTNITLLPERRHGRFYFGVTDTRFRHSPSDAESTLIGVAGSASNFLAHVAMRELLKTGVVPEELQPTMQWYALSNKIAFYYQVIHGLSQTDHFDLGDEDVGISVGFLLAGLLYDIYDIALTDSPERYFRVLFGESSYTRDEHSKGVEISPVIENRSIGVRIGF